MGDDGTKHASTGARSHGWFVLVGAVFLGFLLWLDFFPPNVDTAIRVVGVVQKHEPITRPNGRITDNDVLTVVSDGATREIYLERKRGVAGTVVSGKPVVALVDRRGWILSLFVEGREAIDFETSVVSARRTFWGQAAIMATLLALLLIFASATSRGGQSNRHR